MQPAEDVRSAKLAGTWFLLAHGAGAGSSSPWMLRWRKHLESLGPVECFDYPYVHAGRRRPDPLPRLIEAHRAQLDQASARHQGRGVLVGKSLGSRVGCHLSLEYSALRGPVMALVCLGYPLRSPAASRPGGRAARLRDEVLLQMKSPVLFVQGTRDPLCPLDLLNGVRARMVAPNELHVVEAGDHSLLATKTYLKQTHETQLDLETAALGAIADFLARSANRGP